MDYIVWRHILLLKESGVLNFRTPAGTNQAFLAAIRLPIRLL
jgi:hypothetical protein